MTHIYEQFKLKKMKRFVTVPIFTFLVLSSYSQDLRVKSNITLGKEFNNNESIMERFRNNIKNTKSLVYDDVHLASLLLVTCNRNIIRKNEKTSQIPFENRLKNQYKEIILDKNAILKDNKSSGKNLNKSLVNISDDFFTKNRRKIYSSLWAFASLNYLYCDIVGLMDEKVHAQYQSGWVDGTKITPQFLTMAAAFMQIPLANVFLPHLIKNERTLRWIQIASGAIMSLVQSSTLFVGKPTPYYSMFWAFEISATTFITINAIRWKTNSKNISIL